MWEAGFTLEEIGDYLGHSSAYMTEHYRHLRDDRRDEAAAKMDAFLAGASTSRRMASLDDD